MSAPNFVFGLDAVPNNALTSPLPANVISGDPSDFILEDLNTQADGYPGAAIGGDPRLQLAKRIAMGFPGDSSVIYGSYSIGGQNSKNDQSPMNSVPKVIISSTDPFTGKEKKATYVIKGGTTKQGETVFRQSNNPAGGTIIELGEIT